MRQVAGVAPAPPTPPPFIWGLNTRTFGGETRVWNLNYAENWNSLATNWEAETTNWEII